MRYHFELKYDASPEDVYAMLAEPSFRERTVEAQRGRDYTVTVEPSGDGMSVVVDQNRPSDDLPGFARKIVGDQINIVQKESWSDHANAGLDVAIPGKPGRLKGSITLDGDDSGSVQVIDGDLKVSVPVLSGKLEKLISDLLDASLRAEQKVGHAWLAGDS